MSQLTKGTQKTEILLNSLFICSAQEINDEKIYYLPYLPFINTLCSINTRTKGTGEIIHIFLMYFFIYSYTYFYTFIHRHFILMSNCPGFSSFSIFKLKGKLEPLKILLPFSNMLKYNI